MASGDWIPVNNWGDWRQSSGTLPRFIVADEVQPAIAEDLPSDNEETHVPRGEGRRTQWTLEEARNLNTSVTINCSVQDVGVIMMVLENAGYEVETNISPDFDRRNEMTI